MPLWEFQAALDISARESNTYHSVSIQYDQAEATSIIRKRKIRRDSIRMVEKLCCTRGKRNCLPDYRHLQYLLINEYCAVSSDAILVIPLVSDN